MKINKSQLRKIILESLLVEAISVAQAEAKLKKEKIKIWKSMIFVMKRDGVDTLRAAANKYGYSPSPPHKDRWKDPEAVDFAGEIIMERLPWDLFANIDSFVPIDVNDADRSNAILWLIKQFKSDLGLFFALTEEEVLIDANGGNQAEANLTNKIRNNLEKFSQFKHLINPPEKRDLFRIANTRELFSIVEAHDAAIDAENERLSARIDTQNVLNGFKSLTGKINATKENNTLILVKNPQTGFYTIPDENGFVIGEIHSKAAAVKLGSGTDWCTAAPGLSYFDDYYTPEDPLYYIEDNGKRYQFAYDHDQFMNAKDESVSEKLFQKYTDILKNLLIRRDGSIQNKKIEKAILVRVAGDPNAAPEELDKLSRHEDTVIRACVAFNRSTSKKTLENLVNDKEEHVILSLAKNPSISPKTILKLEKLNLPKMDRWLAANPGTLPDALIKYSKDKNKRVRAAVAGNIATPLNVLLDLAGDPDAAVTAALLGHGSRFTPGQVGSVQPSTPIEVLVKLLNKEDAYTKGSAAWRLAKIPDTPLDILLQIYRSEDPLLLNKQYKEAIEQNPVFIEYINQQNQQLQERWIKIAGLLN